MAYSKMIVVHRGQTTFSIIFIHKKEFLIKSLTLFLLMSIQPVLYASTWQGLAVQNNKPSVNKWGQSKDFSNLDKVWEG